MQAQGFEGTLAQHPFFRDLAPEHLATISGCASNEVCAAGTFLCREGQAADRFYVLRFGRVAVEIATPVGGPVVVETVEPGEVLGWSWLFPPYKWHFDARATTLVRMLALDGACLRKKCDEDPRLGYALMGRFAQLAVRRLEATQLQLLDLYVGKP
jgi:CRP/FNR family transcriptional regulator, cyclic AMP receptor protein